MRSVRRKPPPTPCGPTKDDVEVDWFSLSDQELAEIRAELARHPEALEGVEAFAEVPWTEDFIEADPVNWDESIPTEAAERLERAMLEASLAYFASQVLSGPPEAPYNGRFLVSEHHETWSDLVSEHRRICILAPRDHGKSHFFTFAYPIWMAWRFPNKSGFIFSATQQQARDILERIKDEIEANPRLVHLLPTGINRKWSANEIRLANGHRILARGMGTKVRGAHPQYVVLDDALNDETAYSELVRTKQIDYFRKAITPMVHTSGTIIVVGTPFHATDLYGVLRTNEVYSYAKFQAWDSKTKTALWPERFDEPALEERLKEIGSVAFARELMCNPVSDDTSLFPDWLFRQPDVLQPAMRLGMPKKFWDQFDIEIFMGMDFAISTNVGADETVIWVMGVDRWGVRWLVDVFVQRGMPYRAQKSKAIEMWKRYDPSMVFLEANQMQRIFGDTLITDTDMPITKFTTRGEEKNDLIKGLPSLRILLENRKFRLPYGDAHTVEMVEKFITQMRDWTFEQGKPTHVGDHDDMTMACWICDQAIRQGGGNASLGIPTTEELRERGESLDAMIRRQIEESNAEIPDDATGPSPFDLLEELIEGGDLTPEDLQQVFEGEKTVPREVVQTLNQYQLEDDEDEGDEDTPSPYHNRMVGAADDDEVDAFTGQPLRDDWRPQDGAPTPASLRARWG